MKRPGPKIARRARADQMKRASRVDVNRTYELCIQKALAEHDVEPTVAECVLAQPWRPIAGRRISGRAIEWGCGASVRCVPTCRRASAGFGVAQPPRQRSGPAASAGLCPLQPACAPGGRPPGGSVRPDDAEDPTSRVREFTLK